MYPLVFDKGQRSFDTGALCVLDHAAKVCIRQVVNGAYTLSLSLPFQEGTQALLVQENLIVVKGQAFRIRSAQEERDRTGRLAVRVRCEHVSYDLNDLRHLPDMNDVINVTPEQVFHTGYQKDGTVLEGLFEGTGFSLTCDVSGSTDLFLHKTTPRAILNHFLGALPCEAVYDNWSIRLVPRMGDNNGMQLLTGKNLAGIARETDSTALVTRLYPYGDDYLDISSVNGGVPYIDSPIIGAYDYIHEGYQDFSGVTDPQALKDKAAALWSTGDRDGIDKPKATYEVQVVELSRLAGFSAGEKFSLGDTVRVMDASLGIDVNARIMEYEHYPYEPERSRVVLANFQENIGGVFAELLKAKRIVEHIVTGKGRINDALMQSVRRTMQMRFNAALSKKTIIHDFAHVWVDDADNPRSAIALVDGMFALASGKTPTGDWDWRVIGDGGRLVADEVMADWVYGGQIQAGQIQAGTINTNAITISSGDGRMRMSGNQLHMSASGSSLTNLLISPTVGMEYTHTFDGFGRPLKKTVFDANGAGVMHYIYYTSNPSETGTPLYSQYIRTVFMDTLGGGQTDPDTYAVTLTSPAWADLTQSPKVIVTPAETLRFVQSDGGRLNDLSQYRCNVSSVDRTSGGIVVHVDSWKTYVKSITNNIPNFVTGSLRFNILVMMT